MERVQYTNDPNPCSKCDRQTYTVDRICWYCRDHTYSSHTTFAKKEPTLVAPGRTAREVEGGIIIEEPA